MTETVKITPAMFNDVYRSLLRDWNPRISESSWRRAFQSSRSNDEDFPGYALLAGGKVVGVLGTIFSQRQIGGRTERFCNLHSWLVDPEYRARSLLLLRPIMQIKDCTLTDLTAANHVITIMKRFGFESLDRMATVLPSLPWKPAGEEITLSLMTGPPSRYADVLSATDLQIYRDHQDLSCGHLLAETPQGYCYLVFSTIRQRWLPHCSLHYVSNRRLFVDHHAAIRTELQRASGRRWIVVDTRLLAGLRAPYSFQLRATEKLYRSSTVAPRDIDSLYSEQVILKHSSLAGVRTQLRETIKQYTPAPMRRLWSTA